MTASPFKDNNRQWAWNATSLGYFKSCARQYQYAVIEGWRARGESHHLTFGSHYHKGLERYERLLASGSSHDDAQREMVSGALYDTWQYDAEGLNGAPWDSGDANKNRETLIRSLIWYTEKYRDDSAKTFILANGAPAVELSFQMEFFDDYVLCGHLDKIVEWQDGIYVLDHKTTQSTISPAYFEGYSPDNQMSLYSIAGKVTWNAPIKGVIIEAAQIAVGFTRHERGMTYRTEAQMEEWLADAKLWIGQAAERAAAGYWPMNDKSCRFCQFKRICTKDPSVRERFLETDFIRQPFNPLEIR